MQGERERENIFDKRGKGRKREQADDKAPVQVFASAHFTSRSAAVNRVRKLSKYHLSSSAQVVGYLLDFSPSANFGQRRVGEEKTKESAHVSHLSPDS